MVGARSYGVDAADVGGAYSIDVAMIVAAKDAETWKAPNHPQ
jgi:hypothetical protein